MGKTMWRRLKPGQTEHSGEGTALEEVEVDLVRRGVSVEAARRAACRIERQLRGLPSETAGFVLDGAALVLSSGSDLPGIAAAEIREGLVVRRLVSDFARELQKLDEIVKVLNAYLCRIQSPGNSHSRRLQ